MQRDFDKLDVDLKFMDLAMQIFKLIEEEIKKDISIADINRLARTMLLVQKSIKRIAKLGIKLKPSRIVGSVYYYD